MERVETINPGILVWARHTAGLSLEEAAERVGITASTTHSAAEKLEAIESGAKFPTRHQLTKFASVYRRPIITFYMRQPPILASRGEDFRALPTDIPPRESAKLDALLRDIRARQEMVKGLLEDQDDRATLDFVASAAVTSGVQFVVDSIAAKLEFPLNAKARRDYTPEELFKALRHRVQRIGVFVLLIGDLGSHHHTISEKVFRGFAIADKIAPFVVINDQDAKAARSFTLIHELAHIWLGQTGISGQSDEGPAKTSQGRIEQFCNDVAGRFLLPDEAFAAGPSFEPNEAARAMREITRIAEAWGVSEPMVAYCMNRMGWISDPVYHALTAQYEARWQAFKVKEKEKAKASDGGPSYYIVRRFKLGDALLGVVYNALRNRQISHTKAAKVLGVHPSSVEPLLEKYESHQGAFTPDAGR